jgi:hypothetical protein
MELTATTLLDAIKPAAIVYRSDQDAWADVPAKYKRADGSPRIDPATVQETQLVQWVDPEDVPPIP